MISKTLLQHKPLLPNQIGLTFLFLADNEYDNNKEERRTRKGKKVDRVVQ